MLRTRPRRNFGSTSLLFSRYTSRRGECASGEQQEGAAETPTRTGGGTWKLTHLHILGLSKKRGQSERDIVVNMH
jgi:hypothetical protein